MEQVKASHALGSALIDWNVEMPSKEMPESF
jgi:hypothetical protein